ncbi:CaiB/BaiF CoA transferase family protein [Sulfitobacter geojensis]|uniref:CaiB/BaiF CoA transferase family protein n=1 Tax=Sulfitobacter geojensis TaxID=1342299 RepID=UPI000468354A|nr:CaiB/BaiF CoA-transferase family protein [Sulfitobacter geojensis]KHA54061.1 Alpha-methylacyl-CoA racemase [Sulfitobacter geojensis]NYI29879.1 alpha-methylacyl-CoA racemase [Sulfitobacter geojensis]
MSKIKPTDGPLSGLRVIELAGIGPAPFACMMLADMGAQIIRVERPGQKMVKPELNFMIRGRQSVAINMKMPEGLEVVLRLIDKADCLIEGYRPGAMERLGLGPDVCLGRNSRLVYGRMTGWGQDGMLAQSAGHDLNYIAITGALWASGSRDQAPAFPMNLLGDFGGGGMLLAFGVVSALLRATRTGRGDLVDAAICDGTVSLMTMIYSMRARDLWEDRRAANFFDGGAPWYNVYECQDGNWITIGALEPQFWTRLLELLEMDPAKFGDHHDPKSWPDIRRCFTALFLSKPRDHWSALLENTDACFAPVLSPAEAAFHPHNKSRRLFSDDGLSQPMPVPRFAEARTPLPSPPPKPGADTRQVLEAAGFSKNEVERLFEKGAVS